MNNSSRLRVHVHWFIQSVFFLFSLLLFFVAIWLVRNIIVSLSITSFFGIAFVLIVSWILISLALSRIEMSSEKIRVKVPYGSYSMRWDEMERIITDGGLFSFQGGEKQISVSMVKAGNGKKEFYELLNNQIVTYRIQVVVPSGFFGLQWNEVKQYVSNDGSLIFQDGDNQLLTFIAMATKGKKDAYEFLKKQIETGGIVVKPMTQVPLLHNKTHE